MAVKRSYSVMNTIDIETEDLISCNVCLENFNGDDRKPKFLPCSHSTCLICLQSMVSSNRHFRFVQCPLCREKTNIPRGGVANFPNNLYILHILKMKQQIMEDRKQKAKEYWCLTCGSSLIHHSHNNDLNLPIKTDFGTAQSLFILKFKRGNLFLGEVYIKPSLNFNPMLMSEWGNICFRRTRLSDCRVIKRQQNTYLTMDVEHPYFTTRIPSFWTKTQAEHAFDVGVAVNMGTGEWVNGWEFVFLLKDLPPRHLVPPEDFPYSSLFGHIIKGYEVLSWISCHGHSCDQQADLVATWESV